MSKEKQQEISNGSEFPLSKRIGDWLKSQEPGTIFTSAQLADILHADKSKVSSNLSNSFDNLVEKYTSKEGKKKISGWKTVEYDGGPDPSSARKVSTWEGKLSVSIGVKGRSNIKFNVHKNSDGENNY